MSKPLALDLFCGAGGAAMGYHRAGFEVVGIDHEPQPNFPFAFVQADALEYVSEHGGEYDVIHASPPCQKYSRVSRRNARRAHRDYPDLIADTREALPEGTPSVIENVPEARPLMLSPIRLCGSSFGLDVRRHRLFESNILLFEAPCNHGWQTLRFRSLDSRRDKLASVVGVHGHINYSGEFDVRCEAMRIWWMTPVELSQALPPAFTQWIGSQLIDAVMREEMSR